MTIHFAAARPALARVLSPRFTARVLGRAANDGAGGPDDRADDTALEHQARTEDGDQGRAGSDGLDHVAFSRCGRVNPQW